ncbi:mechanosensitive ion channel family protein [Roseobacteraceae bacterium NS-SX3]
MTRFSAAAGCRPFLCLCAALLAALALLLQLAQPGQAQEPYFETGSLNAGLGDPPELLDRETPMGAMESFLSLTRQGRFAEAAHLLDLGDVPEASQPERGAELAQRLSVVLDRKVVVDWDRLPDRPDGWKTGARENEQTGRVRRSIVLDYLSTRSHDVPLRLNRVKPEQGPAAWVISRQSVGNIDALFYRYGPTRLEQALPGWARQRSFLGLYVWEVIFIPLLVLLAGLLAIGVYRGVGWLGSLWDRRIYNTIIRALRWPAVLAATTAFIGFVTREVLVVSGPVDTFISPVVQIGYVAAATLAAVLAIDAVFDRVSSENPHELAEPENVSRRNIATTVSAARKFVIVTALVLAAGLVLSSASAFQPLGFSLLASAGALTIILGFAAREVLGNILSSVQIALNRSARIGDQVIYKGYFCTVERIHFTYVQLLIWNGNRFIVPVSDFVQGAFENWSIEDVKMIRPITLTLAQTADVEALREQFLRWVREDDGEATGPAEDAKVRVIDQDVFGKKVRFELPTPDPATGWAMECKMRERLLEAARRLQEEEGRQMLPPSSVQDLPEEG